MPNQEIMDKYTRVKNSLEDAVKAASTIVLDNDEEATELSIIRNKLETLNNNFKDEIERLEKSSEWDKYCVAFFGETNSGKSTIIDALRIVYDEEKRRAAIDGQALKLKEELVNENKNYSELILSLKQLNDSLVIMKKNRVNSIIKTIGLFVLGVIVGFLLSLIV